MTWKVWPQAGLVKCSTRELWQHKIPQKEEGEEFCLTTRRRYLLIVVRTQLNLCVNVVFPSVLSQNCSPGG